MRRGFTLVELLVALSIIVILVTITVAAVQFSIEGDRIAGGARQVQSMMEGGRDRAIYAGQPRGVRLVLDPAFTDATGSATAASSLVFIGAPEAYTVDGIRIWRDPASGDTGVYQWVEVIDDPTTPATPDWARLLDRGLLPENYQHLRVLEFPGATPQFFTIDVTAPAPPAGVPAGALTLTKPFATITKAGGPPNSLPDGKPYFGYQLQLNPAILPNQEPRLLPRGIVIDLRSAYVWNKIPAGWYTVTADGGDGSAIGPARANDVLTFVQELDVLFSPRGSGEGEILAQGVVHLPLADVGDLARGFRIDIDALDSAGTAPIVATTADALLRDAVDEAIISIFPRTGSIVVTEPDVLDANADGLRDDAFRYAETGGEG